MRAITSDRWKDHVNRPHVPALGMTPVQPLWAIQILYRTFTNRDGRSIAEPTSHYSHMHGIHLNDLPYEGHNFSCSRNINWWFVHDSSVCNLVWYIPLTIQRIIRMAGKYKIVMVRHGESEWNEKNLFCGWFDANLSEKGIKWLHMIAKTPVFRLHNKWIELHQGR